MTVIAPLGWPAQTVVPLVDEVAPEDPRVFPGPTGWMVPRETPKG